MKRNFGVAALLALLGTGALSGTALAQCGTGPMVILNTASFSYETGAAVTAPYVSALNNNLTFIGYVQTFCAPFVDQNALMTGSTPSEFTIIYTGLKSAGTIHPLASVWSTDYTGGTFEIHQGMPPNAPTSAATMPAATAASIPGLYTDGPVILSGFISGFNITVTQSGPNPANGSYTGMFTFTGGTLFSRVSGTGATRATGNLCVVSGCLPPAGGYSGQVDGKIDNPPTAILNSTWGALKILYR